MVTADDWWDKYGYTLLPRFKDNLVVFSPILGVVCSALTWDEVDSMVANLRLKGFIEKRHPLFVRHLND